MPHNMVPGPAPEGMKWCFACDGGKGKWVAKANFHKSRARKDGLQSACKDCIRVRQARYRQQRRNSRVMDPRKESVWLIERLRDFPHSGGPPGMEASLRYACMKEGFSMRIVPNGETKGQAYCLNCTAGRCVHGDAVGDRQKRIRRRLKREKGYEQSLWAATESR